MATGNRRDVELALRVTTLGQEGIAALEQHVRDLAAQGGAAAPKFEALADEIARLGQSAQNLDAFGRLAREVDELTASQNTNAETAAVLFDELQKLAAGTVEYERAEVAAREALRQSQRDLADKKEALARLRVETDAAGKKTDEYQASVRAARLQIIEAERAVRDLREAYQTAKTATTGAADAESALEKQYAAANRAAQRSAEVLRDRNDALNEARGTLSAAGVATDDLRTSSLGLVDALNRAGAAAQDLVDDEQRAATAAKAHAAQEEYLAGVMVRTRKEMEDAARAEADGIIRDFQRMEQAEREAVTAAQAAARTLDEAFRVTGTRSVQAITAEIDKVRAAMATIRSVAGITGAELDRAMAQGERRIKALEREMRAATGQLTLMDRAAGLLNTTFGQFAGAFTVVEIVQRLGSAFFTTNKELDALRLGLNSIYGDTKLTASQIDFLRTVADRAGISVGAISQSFLKFVASTKAANIPLQQTNALFEAVTRAAGTLGLSGEDVSRILNALGQIAAKGVVSMEELRQQLGDSLPGALSLAAKGLGITEQQLIKLVESGQLAARDLFPALTKALQGMTGEVDTLSASWERFKNFLTLTSQTLGDTGAVDIMKGALRGLGAVLGALVIPLSGFLDLVLTTVRGIGAAVAALMTGDFKNLGPTVQKLYEDALARQAALARSYQHLIGLSDENVTAQQNAATATAAAGSAAQTAAGQIATNTGALQQNAGAAGAVNTTHTAAGAAIDAAGAKALLAGRSWVQLSVAYAENSKQLANMVEVAEKSAKAREIEGRALENLAKLRGDERGLLEASTQAAQGNLAALQNLAEKREAELSALQRYADQLKSVILLQGDPDGARAKQLQELQQRINLLTAETEKVKQSVAVTREEVAAKQLARQAYEDNSAAVERLRSAMQLAQQVMRETQILELNGKATREQVTAATIEAAKATALYNDALGDYARRIQQQMEADRTAATILQGKLSLEAERANSLAALAKNTGDETLATYANVKAKTVERDQRIANASAIALEAARIIEKAEADRAALSAQGKLTDELQRDIDNRIRSAEAKRLEAERIRESTKSLDQEIIALRDGVQARDSSTSSIDRENAALAKNVVLRKQASNLTADGFQKNADGSAAGTFNNNLPVDQAFALANSGGKGFTAEQAKAAFQQAQNAFDDMNAFLKLNPGGASFDYIQSTTALYNKARAAYQAVTAAPLNSLGNTPLPGLGGPAGAPAPTPAPGQSTTTGTSHTVTINLGGKTSNINLASAGDATQLTNLLRQLETAAGTAA